LTPEIETIKCKFFLLDVCFEKSLQWMSQVFVRGEQNNHLQVFHSLRNLICDYFVTLAQAQNDAQHKLQTNTEVERLNKVINLL
jgi:uncharacterized membrane protein